MKSPQITASPHIRDPNAYTDLRVLQSAAGYYVGTLHAVPPEEGGGFEPGSRDSLGYYPTRGAADAALTEIKAGRMQTRLAP